LLAQDYSGDQSPRMQVSPTHPQHTGGNDHKTPWDVKGVWQMMFKCQMSSRMLSISTL